MKFFRPIPSLALDLSGNPAENAMAVSDELDAFIQSYPGSRNAVNVRIVYGGQSDRVKFIGELAGLLAECRRHFTLKAPVEGDIHLKVYFG